MTICIGVRVDSGIVFVSDSATSYVSTDQQGNAITQRVYNHADKVFNLCKGLPVISMTCGIGNFGKESISTIAKHIRHTIFDKTDITPENYTIENIVSYAHTIFSEKHAELDPALKLNSSFEFFVGGFSHNSCDSELWKITIVNDVIHPTLKLSDDFNIVWAGQPEACTRLVLGVSSQTEYVLKNAGLTDEVTAQVIDSIKAASTAPLVEPSMPINDAIHLAEFLAKTSATYVKFLPGADTVGGDLDIATITKYEGFKWIKRKHYYPPSLNGETNHV